jgi:hypothetical protein
MATNPARSWKSVATLVVAGIASLLWCIPLGINSTLVYYQYKQGTGSLFLLEIGIAPYALALVITAVGPLLLRRFHREDQALILAGMMLALFVPAALIWAVGMGST